MKVNRSNTVAQAQAYIDTRIEQGVKCPCCTQYVKIYKYPLFATSARALIELYQITEARGFGYYHVREFAEQKKGKTRAPHFAELRFWGLITAEPDDKEDKKGTGYWKITAKGRKFVEGDLKVPRRIKVFNGKCLGFEDRDEIIGIEDALGNKFNYKKLMEDRL